MKVLLETITHRKGYKSFENVDKLNNFLGKNCNKLCKYEILQEDDDTFIENMKDLAQQCLYLQNKLITIFFRDTNKVDRYNQILYAAGRIYDAYVAVKKYVK